MRITKKLTIVTIWILLVVFLSIGGTYEAVAAPCTTTLIPGNDIQTAINGADPGDVICLNPGNYFPQSKINVSESVTLQGPQAGVDPRPSAGTTRTPGDSISEAIIDGSSVGTSGIMVITADNVILDGLQVRNGSSDLIDSEEAVPTAGTILRYNIIDTATSDEAIQLRNVDSGVIEYNYIFDVAQDGINMCCESTGGTIQFNEVNNSSSENAAIYVYESTDMLIQCNLVYNVTVNDGIKLGSKGGGDAALTGGSIIGNVVHDTKQDGITVYMSDTVVDSNEVYNSSSENGGIYLAWEIENITVTKNFVHDNTLSTIKPFDPGGITVGERVNAATVHVNNNNITDNWPNGVTNLVLETLDAKNNWWGAADGPGGVGLGSGDEVSTGVEFDPFLSEAQEIDDPCQPPGPEDVLDHFKCYSVREIPPKYKKFVKKRIVHLEDQFQKTKTLVKYLDLICIPVDKNDELIKNPENFILNLYSIRDLHKCGRGRFKKRVVKVTDQFGEKRLKVIREKFLAVPATKEEVAP